MAAGVPSPALHLTASLGTRVLAVVSPLVLVGLGVYGVLGTWAGPGPVLVVFGVALAVAVARSIPWRCSVGADGVEVAMPAKRVVVPWDDVIAFERHRQGRRGGGALIVRDKDDHRTALCDVAERPADWDTLRELVSLHAKGVAVPPPPPGHPFLRDGSGGAGRGEGSGGAGGPGGQRQYGL